MRTTHINAPKKVAAPGELYNATYSQSDSTYLTNTEQVYDYTLEKSQEEFNIEVAQAITSLQNLETVDSYSKPEIDSKLDLINQELANLATSLNTEYTRATTKESELAGRISNLETAAPNYITADNLEKYNSSKTVKFNGIISSATIVPEGYDGSSSTLYIYYIEDKKTFGASRTMIPSGVLSAPLAIEWTDRLLYAKNQIASVPTIPYEDKIYICKGIAYIWTGTELKSVGVDELKAYYLNSNGISEEINSFTIANTLSTDLVQNVVIPTVAVVNNKINGLAEQALQISEYVTEECQPKLESGVNIKTINNESLLGEGNIQILGITSTIYDNFESTNGTNLTRIVGYRNIDDTEISSINDSFATVPAIRNYVKNYNPKIELDTSNDAQVLKIHFLNGTLLLNLNTDDNNTQSVTWSWSDN